MAGDGIVFAWDDEDLQAAVKEHIRRTDDLSPVMKAFAEEWKNYTEDRFAEEKDPQGNKWKPLSQATKKQKEKLVARGKIAGMEILHREGFLETSIFPESGKDFSGLYSSSVYAAIHNRGGKAGRNRAVTIPKREFMGFAKEDIRAFQETVADWIVLGRR